MLGFRRGARRDHSERGDIRICRNTHTGAFLSGELNAKPYTIRLARWANPCLTQGMMKKLIAIMLGIGALLVTLFIAGCTKSELQEFLCLQTDTDPIDCSYIVTRQE